MSRIGKKPIIIEPDIKVIQKENRVVIEGPSGVIELAIPPTVTVNIKGNQIDIGMKEGTKVFNEQGLFRTLLQNAVSGVKNHWTKVLELVGVGYRAEVRGSEIVLNVGFTNQVVIPAPKGLSFKVEENKITVSGADKYLVGETAATIRRVRPPEPYKGKGIKYQGEYIRKKLGKAAKAVGGTAGGAK